VSTDNLVSFVERNLNVFSKATAVVIPSRLGVSYCLINVQRLPDKCIESYRLMNVQKTEEFSSNILRTKDIDMTFQEPFIRLVYSQRIAQKDKSLQMTDIYVSNVVHKTVYFLPP
jgi:hypothetical protein